jgi:hypothetical protein
VTTGPYRVITMKMLTYMKMAAAASAAARTIFRDMTLLSCAAGMPTPAVGTPETGWLQHKESLKKINRRRCPRAHRPMQKKLLCMRFSSC